jgi:hypothetical protein
MEINRWRQTMGFANADTKLRLTRSWDASKKPPESKGPKHGKVLALLVQKYVLTGTTESTNTDAAASQAPDGKRHAGGNTWAGGTGGTDTAGMGGKGGPYRLDLDDGHPVMQISDEEKANVSKEAREAARQMGQAMLTSTKVRALLVQSTNTDASCCAPQEALAKRLQEIGMSEYEDALYRYLKASYTSSLRPHKLVT